jgi:hypothetical protein
LCEERDTFNDTIFHCFNLIQSLTGAVLRTYIIFSAFGRASDFDLLKSLQSFSGFDVICLTSKKYKKSWDNLGITTYSTFFNPMSFISKSVRFLLRKFDWLPFNIALRNLVFHNYNLRNLFVVPHNLRHFLSLEVLLNINPEDYVFLVDARDLIFQESPSEISKKLIQLDKIQLFEEGDYYFQNGAKQDFLSSPANRNWLRQILNGNKEYDSFELKSVVINSGCISGKAKDLTKLLIETTNLISKSNFGISALLDQAALNAVAYQNSRLKKLVHINKNGELVLNMCGVVKGPVELFNGMIKNNDLITPIVHQFDRFGHYSLEAGLVLDRREYRVQKD